MALTGTTGFPDHRFWQGMADLSATVKACFYLSEEGATCGPFAIIVAKKLSTDEWSVDYLHTGNHSATVVRNIRRPQFTYLIDSSLRAAYELPSTGYLWSSANHAFHVYGSYPPSPHGESPFVYRSNNSIIYVPKKSCSCQTLAPTTRRQLIERPLSAAFCDSNIILLIRKRTVDTNRFAISIFFDLQTRVIRFRGQGIDKKIALVIPTGQTCWNDLIMVQLHLYSLHALYPRQLSAALLRQFTRIIFARLYSLGSRFKKSQLASTLLIGF